MYGLFRRVSATEIAAYRRTIASIPSGQRSVSAVTDETRPVVVDRLGWAAYEEGHYTDDRLMIAGERFNEALRELDVEARRADRYHRPFYRLLYDAGSAYPNGHRHGQELLSDRDAVGLSDIEDLLRGLRTRRNGRIALYQFGALFVGIGVMLVGAATGRPALGALLGGGIAASGPLPVYRHWRRVQGTLDILHNRRSELRARTLIRELDDPELIVEESPRRSIRA